MYYEKKPDGWADGRTERQNANNFFVMTKTYNWH